jgi:DNA-binding response OmpR family regulator
MRALARRPASALDPVLKMSDLALNPATRTVTRAGAGIALTAREFALLEYLLRTFPRVVTRAQIIEHVWDDNFEPVGNVVDVLIGRVRRKVDRSGMTPLIHTVRGVGYLLSDQLPADAD